MNTRITNVYPICDKSRRICHMQCVNYAKKVQVRCLFKMSKRYEKS